MGIKIVSHNGEVRGSPSNPVSEAVLALGYRKEYCDQNAVSAAFSFSRCILSWFILLFVYFHAPWIWISAETDFLVHLKTEV